MNFIQSGIILRQLELHIHLGWPESERLKKQSILIDIHIHFKEPPSACYDDELDEKTDYDRLSQKIIAEITPRTFKLIEHVGFEIYQILKSFLPENTRAAVCVTKYPAVKHLKGDVRFWYGDTLPWLS